jgi:hypothetical protein
MYTEKIVNEFSHIQETGIFHTTPSNTEIMFRLTGKLPDNRRWLDSEDVGPQRWCNACGSKVYEFEPEILKREVSYRSTKAYREFELRGWKCPECGVLSDEEVRHTPEKSDWVHVELTMDDLRNQYKKIVRTEWYKEHKDVLKKIYIQHADDAGVDQEKECCSFYEESNDDSVEAIVNGEEHLEGTSINESIACEENTRESLDELKFWRRMSWLIGHYPEKAYDEVISMFNEDNQLITEDDVLWVCEVTKGLKNSPKFRYALFAAMVAKKCNKRNPLRWVPTKEEKFSSIGIEKIKSWKYPGHFMYRISFEYYGERTVISKVDCCSNWLTSVKLPVEDLNEVIILAREIYKNR